MQIGFIGVGLMGQGMVTRLLKAGHQVRVMAHRNRAPIEAVKAQGASEAGVSPSSPKVPALSFSASMMQKPSRGLSTLSSLISERGRSSSTRQPPIRASPKNSPGIWRGKRSGLRTRR